MNGVCSAEEGSPIQALRELSIQTLCPGLNQNPQAFGASKYELLRFLVRLIVGQ